MTAEALFKYADRFATRNEDAGMGTVYPTVRQAAKRFRTTQHEVQDACESYSGVGYMGLVVAYRLGSGVSEIERVGDYEVEAYV